VLIVLVLNAGSSSLKFALFDGEEALARGSVDRLGERRDHAAEVDEVLRRLPEGARPEAVGHRVVHGGDRFQTPVRITPSVLGELEALVPLAPLHEPHNLGPVHALAERQPELPQVACFDTAFHALMPRLERLLPLPRAYFEKGVKRYGFHGLSYEYVASRLPELDRRAAEGRTVVCHLGSGASMCALLAGQSIATTMSFTALDGLMMGTRCGALDPGAVLYLQQTEGLDAEAVSDLLYKRSGLLGVSGLTSDMRDLLSSSDPNAREAVELFCHRVARELGSLAAALEGLDALVFTGGIGAHAVPVRARICQKAAWLGIAIDAEANAASRTVLHTAESAVSVLVVPTDEERMIARHVRSVLGS